MIKNFPINNFDVIQREQNKYFQQKVRIHDRTIFLIKTEVHSVYEYHNRSFQITSILIIIIKS